MIAGSTILVNVKTVVYRLGVRTDPLVAGV